MKNQNSNTLMLLTGIVAGAAAVYFLKSPKGKEVVNLMLEKGEALNDKLADHSNATLNESKQLLDKTIKSGESLMSNVAENLKEKVDDAVSDFEKGVKQAKHKLNNV